MNVLRVPGPAWQPLMVEGPHEELGLWVGQPDGPPRAEIFFTHGHGEHAGRYRGVAERMMAQGFRFIAYDVHGHGRSGGRRGDLRRYGVWLDDLEWVAERFGEAGVPRLYMGHSLGGQITLQYLLERRPACIGAIVASPWLRLAFSPGRWQLACAHLARWVFPGWRQRSPARVENLTADEAYWHSLPERELMHGLISPRLYFQVLEVSEQLMRRAAAVTQPLLLIHGGADEVTCATATREFAAGVTAPGSKMLFYPEARHETHNDVGRERVLSDTVAWIEARLAQVS